MMSKQFYRIVQVTFPDFTLDSEKLTIYFDIPFDNDVEPNESKITIYNLSPNTLNRIKKNQKVTVNAGYKGDVGTVLSGYVSYVETDYSGADKATTIHVLDGPDLENRKTLKKAYKKNIKASQIINDLLPMLGVPIGSVDLPIDVAYAKGYTVDGSITDALESIAADCGASYFINRGKIYIRSIQIGEDINFTLNADTGLIGTPEPFSNDDLSGYKVKCLLNHRMTTASIINLESKGVKGKFRVWKGSYKCSSNDFILDMELIG
jgi:hypothetical protein